MLLFENVAISFPIVFLLLTLTALIQPWSFFKIKKKEKKKKKKKKSLFMRFLEIRLAEELEGVQEDYSAVVLRRWWSSFHEAVFSLSTVLPSRGLIVSWLFLSSWLTSSLLTFISTSVFLCSARVSSHFFFLRRNYNKSK